MTLDEAIEHCEQTARSCDGECSDDHHQLAEWLRELRRLREERDELRVNAMMAVIGRDTFRATSKRLRDENAKLRKLARDLWEEVPKSAGCGWYTADNCCTGECYGECIYWYRMKKLGVKRSDMGDEVD